MARLRLPPEAPETREREGKQDEMVMENRTTRGNRSASAGHVPAFARLGGDELLDDGKKHGNDADGGRIYRLSVCVCGVPRNGPCPHGPKVRNSDPRRYPSAYWRRCASGANAGRCAARAVGSAGRACRKCRNCRDPVWLAGAQSPVAGIRPAGGCGRAIRGTFDDGKHCAGPVQSHSGISHGWRPRAAGTAGAAHEL